MKIERFEDLEWLAPLDRRS